MALKAALALILLAGAAWAEAPTHAPAPLPRPEQTFGQALAAKARVTGDVSFIVTDLATGAVLEELRPDLPLPPASVAKAPTAIYALDRLGPEHRFTTQVLATGPLEGGVLRGDLILRGGGDPELDTKGLDALAADLALLGLTRVEGRFLVDVGLFPVVEQIADDQPLAAAYNPSVSSLNLNFNRAHAEWRREGADYVVDVEARAGSLSPPTDAVAVTVADETAEGVFDYALTEAKEVWTVRRSALGAKGGRWLPVRRAAQYAGRTFQALAAAKGVALPAPEPGVAAADARALTARESRPLGRILRSMLKYSTNLTAEAVGVGATMADGGAPRDLGDSAQAMNAWAHAFTGHDGLALTNHSGLSGASRATTRTLAALLAAAADLEFGAGETGVKLADLLKKKTIAVKSAPKLPYKVDVRAKTGTMHFVNALAGYLTVEGGRRMAFAIIVADPHRRDRAAARRLENPRGSRAYAARARSLQVMLLRSWVRRFGRPG